MAEIDEKFKGERIIEAIIDEEMKEAYIDYAMSVIVGRALPDARDGLKPVHRRILFAMNDLGMFHNKSFKKSARIVGEVLGKYHPHGDVAVYDSLVRMTQDFSLRYPLINGHGNFGSIDGDSAAAMRYTEARLTKLSEELLKDIEKKTVPFIPNFDGSLNEPFVLPSKFPNLLLNGSSGIAVGMATNIPPHNMNEVIDGIKAFIDNPEISLSEIMQHVKGPDFPTGGTIVGKSGILRAYKKGRGKIKIVSKMRIEDEKNRIIITEIPYQVNKSDLIIEIADNVKNGIIEGISDIRDESSSEGIRVVIELKRGANAEVVKNQMLKHSRLKVTFGINMLALVDNQPKLLSLKEAISVFVEHRKDVITRRTKYDLRRAELKAHLLQGVLVALKNIDEVVALIKKSKNVNEASEQLISKYELSEKQAKAILEMRLQKLSSLEQQKIKDEFAELQKIIAKLKEILASEQKILDIIKDELKEIRENFGDERKTSISDFEDAVIEDEDLIKSKEVVITISHQDYIKTTEIELYKQQKRGGKGIIAASTKDEDFIEHLFVANTHDYIMFFTNKGSVYWLKVYRIPEVSRQSKGKPIVNLLNMDKDETITAMIPVSEFDSERNIVMFTKKGVAKKSSLSDYSRPRKGGIRAINLDDGDELIDVLLTSGEDKIIIATRKGMAARFREKDVRRVGRVSRGVRGIKLNKGDEVVNAILSEEGKTVLTITEKGYGKRSVPDEYRLINRGGKGVINIKITDKNGKVVSVKNVEDTDELMIVSKNGKLIRVPVKNISVIGRNTQGVRVMKLNEGDKVVSTAKVVEEKDEDTE